MDDDYKVGHGKPPLTSRWSKGRSGNPRGRPKGSRNFATELAAELLKPVQVRENGKSRTVTKQAALAKSLLAKAIQGEGTALTLLVKLIAQVQPAEPAAAPDLSASDQEILADALKRHASKGNKP